MSKLQLLKKRINDLEQKTGVGPVYVVKTEGWGFGVAFPGDSLLANPPKSDWPWDPRCQSEDPEIQKENCMIGATYDIYLEGPGIRFETREAAERWIEKDKKRYPLNTVEWECRQHGD